MRPFSRHHPVGLRKEPGAIESPFGATTAGVNATLRAILEFTKDRVAIFDKKGRLLFINRSGSGHLGVRDPSTLVGSTWDQLWEAKVSELVRAAIVEALAGRETRFTESMLDGQGVAAWWDVAISPILDADGRPECVVAVSRDITVSRSAEHRLRLHIHELEASLANSARAARETSAKLAAERQLGAQLQAALAEAQRLMVLGQLTGGVAHDFNNILLAIQGSFELLTRRVHDDLGMRLVQNGSMAAERAAGLVRNLLAIARQQEQHPVAIDLTAVLAGIGDLVRQAVGHKVTLVIEAVPAGTWHVFGRPHEIEVALLNLAVNGRDAMPEGGTLTISARNLPGGAGKRWPGQPDGDCVLLMVRDTGTGMSPEVLARAAEPFFTTKAPGKGTGLGLAMVRNMAQRFGGELHIESAGGDGTTMILALPQAEHQSIAVPAAVVEIDRARHGDAVLLVVDDDEQVRAVTAGFLRDIGYRVVEAANGEAAYALAQTSGSIDLVVTDVAMPGVDGPMLAARLRARWPALPIIFITGFSGNANLTGEVVLAKPYAFSKLAEQVTKHLGRAANDLERAPCH